MQTGRPSERKRPPFGERLDEAREKAGLTQALVAAKLGISPRAYAFWEREPVALRPEQIAALAQALGMGTDELLGSPAAPRKQHTGPTGKLRRLFEEVSRLPRNQQMRIAGVVEDMIAARR
jgi:transcriptional regulator with XRE-family HTH domain